MKSFVNYLAESERTYDYRIKVCGELSTDAMKQIRAKLDQFDPARVGDIKTTPVQVDALKAHIQKHHPYETPELLFLGVEDCLEGYGQWVKREARSE